MARAALQFSALILLLALPGPAFGHGRPRADTPTYSDVLAAEAARAATPEQLEVLVRAARAGSPGIQRAAVRALGRLERPQLEATLVPFLSVANATVRAEAANAIAQAAGQDMEAGRAAKRVLLGRLAVESDPDVRSAICEALGRLPLEKPDDVSAVERVLSDETARVASKKGVTLSPASPLLGVRIGWGGGGAAVTPAVVGALRGLESLLRLRGKIAAASPATVERLRHLVSTAAAPARRLAFLALNAATAADGPTIDRGLGDADVEVRRLAAAAPGATREQVQRGLGDAAPTVRYEALRAYGRRFQAQGGCLPVVAATRDSSPHVALLALDLLGNPCPTGERGEETLLDAAAAISGLRATGGTAAEVGRTLPRQDRLEPSWHRPAHAIVALAKVSPERARPMLHRFLAAEPWQLRMYAARAAAQLGDGDALRRLAADRNPNVQEAAIVGLAKIQQHDADQLYLRALDADDPQLVMAAARALEATPARQPAADALLAALRRWTARDSDTSRDPRLAILARLEELGSRESAASLEPLLTDFDPRVADRAAQVLMAWTGQRHVGVPSMRVVAPVPTTRELAGLSRTVVHVTMKGGATFDVRLLTDLAPLSCAKFARLVEAGYYDGLTFHRVVPNFLIQGGSPGANEYSGDSRFMLDEVGRITQARGTLGTSTRGRDTGDAQFYVNLVDNPRLDHDYTIFGEVTRGMDVVDGILEGDTIERAEVVNAARRPRR